MKGEKMTLCAPSPQSHRYLTHVKEVAHSTLFHLKVINTLLAHVELNCHLIFMANEFDFLSITVNDNQSNHTLPQVRRELLQ